MSEAAAGEAARCIHHYDPRTYFHDDRYMRPGVTMRHCSECGTVDFFNPLENVQQLIAEQCDEVKELLLKKNRDYGNSFAEAEETFGQGISLEQALNVRIGDKLKRMRTGVNAINEDTELDLIGYLYLKRVLRRLNG